jgi:hypothetical protein
VARNEEEKLVMKVVDGVEAYLRCTGSTVEPKCTIKQTQIDFKEVAVCF